MGERQNQPFQLLFNASHKVDFQGSWVTSDAIVSQGTWRKSDECLS
jgi:hypothetical protein